jgi:hypothetical protein
MRSCPADELAPEGTEPAARTRRPLGQHRSSRGRQEPETAAPAPSGAPDPVPSSTAPEDARPVAAGRSWTGRLAGRALIVLTIAVLGLTMGSAGPAQAATGYNSAFATSTFACTGAPFVRVETSTTGFTHRQVMIHNGTWVDYGWDQISMWSQNRRFFPGRGLTYVAVRYAQPVGTSWYYTPWERANNYWTNEESCFNW